MGDHEHEIPEIHDIPRHVWEDEPPSTYGTSLGFGFHLTGPSHEDISHYTNHTHPNRWYWLSRDENHHEPTTTSTIIYGIPDVPETSPTPHVELDADPSTAPRGTSIPFIAERFGSTSHITPSILVVEDYSRVRPRPSTSVPIQGPEPRHVNIGGTSYIPSHIPSSSTPIPSNEFLTMHPPPKSSGPLG